MPTARLNGLDVYDERRGDGAPVLFLNGSGSTLAGMGVLLDVFAGRVDLLAHDQRGLGETEIPPGRTRWPTTRPMRSHCSTTSGGSGRGSSACPSAGWWRRSSR